MGLNLVSVAAAVLDLGDVTGLSQVGDDAVGATLGDAQARGNIAKPRCRVIGDAQQDASMVAQETPVCDPLP